MRCHLGNEKMLNPMERGERIQMGGPVVPRYTLFSSHFSPWKVRWIPSYGRKSWLSLPLAASDHQPVLTALQVRQIANVLLSYQPLICRAAHLKAGFPI